MQLWVGLGNPGAKYALQRHNVGFMAADVIAEAHDFGPWQKKFRSLIAEGRLGRSRVARRRRRCPFHERGGTEVAAAGLAIAGVASPTRSIAPASMSMKDGSSRRLSRLGSFATRVTTFGPPFANACLMVSIAASLS